MSMSEFERAASEKLAIWSDHINARMGTTLRMTGTNLCLASRTGVKIVVSPVPDADRICFTAVLVEPVSTLGRPETLLRDTWLHAEAAGGWIAVEPVTQAICWHYALDTGLSLSGQEFHALVSAFALKADTLSRDLHSGGMVRH